MDILAHGLWAGVACKAINKKIKQPLNVKLAVLWGVLPDLFSFTSVFIFLFWNLIFGGMDFSDFPRPEEVEPIQRNEIFIFRLTSILYSISHSVVIFAVVFGIVFLIFRRPVWELGAWLLHILIDIPTHTYQFYPTPFLWPISNMEINGFSWANIWFMVINYSAIFIIYFLLWNKKFSLMKFFIKKIKHQYYK